MRAHRLRRQPRREPADALVPGEVDAALGLARQTLGDQALRQRAVARAQRASTGIHEKTSRWWAYVGDCLKEIVSRRPPKIDLKLDELADMLTTLVEGGLVLGKIQSEPKLLPRQLLLYRSLVKEVFV